MSSLGRPPVSISEPPLWRCRAMPKPTPAELNARLDLAKAAMRDHAKKRGHITRAHLADLSDPDFDEAEVRRTLLDHYSSPAGLAEIANSPHKALRPEQVVEMLMEDVLVRKRQRASAPISAPAP